MPEKGVWGMPGSYWPNELPLNQHPELLKVGDKVVTFFYPAEYDVIRTITRIVDSDVCSSKRRVFVDTKDMHLDGGIDSPWYLPAEDLPLILLGLD